MSSSRSNWRLAVAALLVLSLAGVIAPAPVASQSAAAPATLEIHSRFCPPGYAGNDLFGDCHDNPGIQGVQFGLRGPRTASGTPEANGNLIFTDLPPGEYQLRTTLPPDMQRPAVYCSPGDGSTANHYPVDATAWEPFVSISLTAGQHLICDWYTIPNTEYNVTRANLTIHNRFCPLNYQGSDLFADCHDDIGIAWIGYTVTGPETREAIIDVGDVTFTWLQPGVYGVSTELDLPARLVCSDFADTSRILLEQTVQNGGPAQVLLSPGVSVVCDWYVFPDVAFYQATTPTEVVAVACQRPESISLARGDLPAGCWWVPNVTVTVYPYLTGPDGFSSTCTTNATGVCIANIRHQVPLNAWVSEGNWPAGYTLAFNPFYAGVMFTEFAHVTVIFLPA